MLSATVSAPEQEPLPSIDGGQAAVVRDEIGERYMESPILKEMCDEV